jgi:hypothetical protein
MSAREGAKGLDDDEYGSMVRAGVEHQIQALSR